MKKIFVTVLIIMGSFGFAMAQTKTKATTPKKAETTAVSQASQSSSASEVKKAKTHPRKKAVKKEANAVAPGATDHLKADGTPDKRFKENKVKKTHLKKDGTPDKRFKDNKPQAKS